MNVEHINEVADASPPQAQLTGKERNMADPQKIPSDGHAPPDRLIESARALLDLDAHGALVPHGIGGHARTIIEGLLRELLAPRKASLVWVSTGPTAFKATVPSGDYRAWADVAGTAFYCVPGGRSRLAGSIEGARVAAQAHFDATRAAPSPDPRDGLIEVAIAALERTQDITEIRTAVMMTGAQLSHSHAADLIEEDRLGLRACLTALKEQRK